MTKYEKPQLISESDLNRDLVYAEPYNTDIPCNTVVQKIKIEDDEAKLT